MPVTMTGGEGADLFMARGSHTEIIGPYSDIYLPNGDPIEVTDFTLGEDLLEVTSVDRIDSITLTETPDGDTEVSVRYVYDTESWGTERFNSATLFVLRGGDGGRTLRICLAPIRGLNLSARANRLVWCQSLLRGRLAPIAGGEGPCSGGPFRLP